jgi:hypothetical protein
MRTLAEFGFDGLEALRWVVTTPNGYPSLEQAVASLTLFVSPDTVAQTTGNIFQMARGSPRRTFDDPDRPTVMWDDNEGPHCALKAAGGPPVTGRHLHLNHLYGGQVQCFTDLRSLCLTPSFLTKLTDSEPRITALLKRRAFEIFDGFAPEGEPTAAGYEGLVWAPPLPAVRDLESVLSDRLRHTSNSIAIAVRHFGWRFNGFSGDPWRTAESGSTLLGRVVGQTLRC